MAQLDNIFDAARGRSPDWFERKWASRVNWNQDEQSWRLFFCSVCAEGGRISRPDRAVSIPMPVLVPSSSRNSSEERVAQPSYTNLCSVCRPKEVLRSTQKWETKRGVGAALAAINADDDDAAERRRRLQSIELQPHAGHDESPLLPASGGADEGRFLVGGLPYAGGPLQTERRQFELAWVNSSRDRCNRSAQGGMVHSDNGSIQHVVLIALPYNDYMPCTLREIMFAQLKRLKCGNPGFQLEVRKLPHARV